MVPVITLEDIYDRISPKVTGSIAPGNFNIIDVADFTSGNGTYPGYNRRTYHKVSLVKGKSLIEYPDHRFELDGTALVFTNPLFPYRWDSGSNHQSGHVAIFTADFLSKFINLEEFLPFKEPGMSVILLNPAEELLMSDLFARIKREFDGSYHKKYELIACIVAEIMHYANKINVTKHVKTRQQSSYERIASQFMDNLERSFLAPQINERIVNRSPAYFADSIGIHVNHLNKVLKELTQLSTSALISRRITQEAAYLLNNSSRPIKEIAYLLGFDEPNHFSSFFKSHSGVSPVVFRQRND